MNNDLLFKFIKPYKALDDFVESYWLLQNLTDCDKEVVVLPDGRVDLIFAKYNAQHFQATLVGIGTKPDIVILSKNISMFAVSFKLPAIEIVFQNSISNLLNHAQYLPADIWEFNENEMTDFSLFYKKATRIIQTFPLHKLDSRKQKLFDLIYSSNGELTVKEMSEKVFWSSRQINRYFNQQFGLSLKEYCNILRFRASFHHLKEGMLFPECNFSDQSHFIKEVKKLAGVSPKQLYRNQNDRFIQFSTLNQK